MKDKIEFIAFDADDTLWESELYSGVRAQIL